MPAFEQDAAALLEPFQIELAGNVILDPDQEHDDQAEHERERQVVMRELCVVRHRREAIGAKQRQNENTAEADVQARQRQNDEATGRQPMGEAFEARETKDRLARKTLMNANPSAHHQEDRQERNHAENGNAADDRQLAAVKIAPVAAGGLNQVRGVYIRDADPPGDLVALLQRIQELVFLDGFGGRLERNLRGGGVREHEQQQNGRA